jgi:hypothetical protein
MARAVDAAGKRCMVLFQVLIVPGQRSGRFGSIVVGCGYSSMTSKREITRPQTGHDSTPQ